MKKQGSYRFLVIKTMETGCKILPSKRYCKIWDIMRILRSKNSSALMLQINS